MNLTNLQILAHNVSYSYLGVDQNNVPVIQMSTLDIGKSLEAFNQILHNFYIRRVGFSPVVYAPAILAALSAEYQTLQAVLRHLAYSKQDFSPQLFGEEVYLPHNWVGQSYYRLVHLTQWGNCNNATIKDAIRSVAAMEALDAFEVIRSAANAATNLILIDAAAYHALAGGEETV